MANKHLAAWSFAGVVTVLALATMGLQRANSGEPADAKLERGKYLVENVAMCGDCHTPKNDKGEPNMAKHLKGAILDFKPTAPVPNWKPMAMPVVPLPNGWTKEYMVEFLQTGKKPGGVVCGPPMPQYRFNAEDADAVADYLMSLGKK